MVSCLGGTDNASRAVLLMGESYTDQHQIVHVSIMQI
jgi:hypothetical protein